jgi:type I restriction enzyme, R subunit
MLNGYTEDYLVEQPAIQLFEELGWATASASEELFGPAGTLGRETRSEVVLVPRLRAALERLNPPLPAEAINFAIDELAGDRSATRLAAANRGVWEAQQVEAFIFNCGQRSSVDAQPAGYY